MPRVICTSLSAEEGPHWNILREAGFEVDVVDRNLDLAVAENLISALKGCQAVVAGSEPYPAGVIESLPELRVISRTGVGFDAIDLTACDRAGVVVTTTPGVNHHTVAEHTIALLMGVARGFPELDRQVRECRWTRSPRPRVQGSTLGLVGLGRIGRATATRAVGLGMTVLACEPDPDHKFVEQWGIELTDFNDLLARSDFLSLHLPMSPESRHLMNAETFAKMKRGSVLINTARGALVDEPALCEALESGQLRGAGLDVFEVEPLPADSPLLQFENVLLSGHVAGMDREAQHDTFKMAAQTIVALYRGEWPSECVQNLKGTDGWTWSR